MNVRIIRADGSEQQLKTAFGEIARLIGAHTLDTVNLRDGRVMLVDDNGYEVEEIDHGMQPHPAFGSAHVFERRPTRALKPINEKATQLYHAVCVPGTTHQIVGDVAIVVDAEVA